MSVFEFSGHTLDIEQGRLRHGTDDVRLRPKSLALLTYFVENPGRVIGKNELIDVIWPGVIVTDGSLSQCLKEIRAALGPAAVGLVRTVPRRGYMFDETRLAAHDGDRSFPAAGATPRPSVAVLPFQTTAPDQDWFSDGVAEDITTALARSGKLRVVSKNYSFAFKGRAVPASEIARALHVRYLLEGSVRLSGQHIRVSTRLIESETGELLWAERFDRDMANIFAIQDEITETVVKHLEIELLPEERRAIQLARTHNVEAYHYELRGRQLAQALTKANLILARRMFRAAAEFDPGYARAFAGMVICDCYLRDWHGADIGADSILALAETALSLDPGLPEAHAARGFALFCTENYEEADLSFRQALAIDPNSYDANFLAATMARFLNDREKMVGLFRLTARLRPDDYVSPMMIAAFLTKDDPERPKWAAICVERAERVIDAHPDDSSPLHRGALAHAYLGNREQAHAWLGRALAVTPDDFIAQVNAACVHACFGEVDQALFYLEKAARHVPQNTIDMLSRDADFDLIRDDPRFTEILRARHR